MIQVPTANSLTYLLTGYCRYTNYIFYHIIQFRKTDLSLPIVL